MVIYGHLMTWLNSNSALLSAFLCAGTPAENPANNAPLSMCAICRSSPVPHPHLSPPPSTPGYCRPSRPPPPGGRVREGGAVREFTRAARFPWPGDGTIFVGAGLPAMAINALWNKRSGPGGSARRLHQFPIAPDPVRSPYGGETGSTRVVKAWFSPGMVPPLSGRFTDANDNEAFAVAA